MNAPAAEAHSYRHVDSILKHSLDRVARTPVPVTPQIPLLHKHVRGRQYYESTEGVLMLTGPTLDKLAALKLDAIAPAWTPQWQDAPLVSLAFDERLDLLVDAEWLAWENRCLSRALEEAKLKLSQASVEAIDCSARRGLDKATSVPQRLSGALPPGASALPRAGVEVGRWPVRPSARQTRTGRRRGVQ